MARITRTKPETTVAPEDPATKPVTSAARVGSSRVRPALKAEAPQATLKQPTSVSGEPQTPQADHEPEIDDVPAYNFDHTVQPENPPVRVGILTVSDRCWQSRAEDLSGPAIQAELATEAFVVVLYAVVPDDRKKISETLKRWTDQFGCDVILTTGGTGLSERDVTPEATRKVIDREAANIAQYLLLKGTTINPIAALSRGVAGLRGQTLIVNLPGSPTGAGQTAQWLREILPHAVDILRGRDEGHPAVA